MPNEFNEQEYRRKLIEGGLSEADATDLAARTAAARRDSGSAGGAFRPAGSLFELPATAGDNKAALPPKPPTPASAAVERSERMARESDELARTMGLPPEPRTAVNRMAEQIDALAQDKRSSAMATKKRTAGGELAEKVSEAKQTALLKNTKQQIKDMQLSLFDLAPWPDHMRALPNDFGRSAIFTVRNKKVPRAALQGQSIYHVNKDVEITYTGIELRADDDELVFAQVLEYAKRTPLGEPVSFTFYELCQDLDWSINGRYYTRAEECLTRLQASAMQFSSQRIGRLESVSLIRRFRVLDRGKRTSRCQVEIDAEIVVLFAGDHYTKFVWEKYRKLSPTARRMFDYFATHKEPYPLKLETFRLMCGSDSTRPKKWREQVGEACDELRENGLVESAWVNDDLVHCKR
ncbi:MULTISPECIES: plasmid replication initiator TrfA [Pseudomonadota]|uniref:Plasmid replication initiator protein TrfA n=2 Tax=Gammaproteobacteria TaxID=1236 RepID=A0A899NBG1_ECOLX|nr:MULTISPECIES: plasmid replication initiator TrfA [Pseudomonadota]APO97584.1 transcriptional regulator [Xanthomonas vesicatoria]KAF1045121.1 MAG: Plasmid replication initiator protein TrfA [Xylophilus sp.]MCC8621293.1 replication initiator protein A [Xanthomonas vesicatoria]MDC4060062.1 replication initiator protein A [Acinetobacter baumannii]QSM61401.1 Plasmid replication initiator protein TrfA [Escherichia coli]